MIYNPIFEEEAERKTEFKKLKKEIKKRARKENISTVINRVYNLLKRKPILTLATLFQPLIEMVRTRRAKVV